MNADTLRVLFIDDALAQSEALGKLIQKRIAPAKVEIFFCNELDAGIKLSHRLTPCIVFLDLLFPGTKDWRETCARIPEIKGAVVVVSELDGGEVELECRGRGAVTVFSKSKVRDLIEIVVRVITDIRLNSLAREGVNNGSS